MKKKVEANQWCARDFDECVKCSKTILTWTLVGNVFLAGLKLFGGALSGSSGLFADGMQSISCVIASVLIMYSLSIAQKKSNRQFPFGYGKVEFIVALVVFSVLVGLGLFISISNFLLILRHDMSAPGIMGLPIAATSILITFMMYRFNVCAGRVLGSAGLTANGLQARADLFSSIAVAIGILLAQCGVNFVVFDRLAALVVGLLIVYDSVQHWLVNLHVILDKVPDGRYKNTIRKIVAEILPNSEIHVIKLKRTGKQFWVGIRLDFPKTSTVANVLTTTDDLRNEMCKKIEWVNEVAFFLGHGTSPV